MANNSFGHWQRQVYWRQGLFLQPQHLQQQDLFHHRESRYLWDLHSHNNWGIASLKFDDSALQTEKINILELELVTRSGRILRCGSSLHQLDRNSILEPRDFKGLLDPTKGSLSVYIAIPLESGGATEMSIGGFQSDANGSRPQLQDEVHSVQDLFDPTLPPVDVDVVVRSIRIVFAQEAGFEGLRASFELVKIAEVVRAGQARAIAVSRTYVPPCLTVSASDVLANILRRVRDTFVARADEFDALKRQRGVRATATSIQEVIRLQMLQTLTRHIPILHSLVEAGRAHPELVYVQLRQILGDLSVFTEDVGPLGSVQMGRETFPNLAEYDHENAFLQFARLSELVLRIVQDMTIGPQAGIRLEYDVESGYFRAKLAESVFEGERNRYYLTIESNVAREKLNAELQSTGRISSFEAMERLDANKLNGLQLTLVAPPEELPQKGGLTSFFAIDVSDPNWKTIVKFKNIAISCALDPTDSVVKLYVVKFD